MKGDTVNNYSGATGIKKKRLSWEHQEMCSSYLWAQTRASNPPIVQVGKQVYRGEVICPRSYFENETSRNPTQDCVSPEQLRFHLCFLSLRFSNSQIIYTNMLFCGHDCRSKSWMREENGTLAISLCHWFTTWVFSVWNAFEGPQTSDRNPLMDAHMPSPMGSSTGPCWYSQQKGLSAPGGSSLLLFLTHHPCGFLN